MLLACGAVVLRGDEEHHLQLLELYFQQCGVELLVVDEVEHGPDGDSGPGEFALFDFHL